MTMPVLLSKGRVYRLAFPPSIRKGEWYLGVKCKGCGQPILSLNDPSGGKNQVQFVGEGQVSIPCAACGHDDRYRPEDIASFQSDKDIPSHLDSRPEPTNSPRQPLVRKYPKAKVTFGIGGLELRPECAKVIARCVTYWTYVESALARLLSVILKANTGPAIAMFLSLRNTRSKNEAIDAAASLTLAAQDYELYLALMAYKDSVEKERNDLAHGVFGVSAAIPDGLAWVSTTAYTNFSANVGGLGLTDELSKDFASKQFVYEVGDLETVAREIEALAEQVGFFTGYINSSDPAWRAERYPQLCSVPQLRRGLDRLRQRQKSDG